MRLSSKVISFAALAGSIFFTACKGKPDPVRPRDSGPVSVDVMIAATNPISNNVEANGTVLANEYVELQPELSGRLTYLNVPEGDFIKKGTVVARINDVDLQAQLVKSKVQSELAVQNEQRLRKLLDINGVNQADYDAALNQVNSLRADVAITKAAIEKSIVRAPFSGIIGLRQISPGAYVSPTTIIATLQQVDKIKIDFTLPESYGSSIRKGSIVNVIANEPNEGRKAVVIAVEPQINPTTRNLRVRAVMQQQKGGQPGAFVKVTLNTQSNRSAIMVPSNCIIPNDVEKQLIIVKNGKAAFVNVETGLRDANNVEIVKGLTAGDSVVITGVLFARDKAPVKVRSVKTSSQLLTDNKPD
ncbi:MAG: efflux RND transporter periplasmic adaptor subunit [Chitinophagaceae bacterium]|nr:efflux RND transporter periplasmic adaptor subunit [Chitinophagaceae bacterium]